MYTICIGDVHGCYYELVELCNKLPKPNKLIFLGDLCDKGPANLATLQLVYTMMCSNNAVLIHSNHMSKLYRYLLGNPVQISNGLEDTISELSKLSPDRFSAVKKMVINMYDLSHMFVKANSTTVAVHAGWSDVVETASPKKAFSICVHNGVYVKDESADIRPDWIKEYTGKLDVIRGHVVYSLMEPLIYGKVLCLDTGCVYGGRLSAYVLETKSIIQVQAQNKYKQLIRMYTL